MLSAHGIPLTCKLVPSCIAVSDCMPEICAPCGEAKLPYRAQCLGKDVGIREGGKLAVRNGRL